MQFLKDIGNGTMKTFTAGDNDSFTNGEARGAAIGYGLIFGIGGGILARKRAERGKPPIAGFIA